ncbi:MAG: OprO/OprP family phosphate-selective porin, partial [Methylococcaceae bacterium]|nr:OprO/OprP family phosphate-selective porin [Methylococcaceae bacterium]
MNLPNLNKIVILIFAGLSASLNAWSLELYVDTKTKQIFAEGGPGRVRLGNFQRVDENTAATAQRNSPASPNSTGEVAQQTGKPTNPEHSRQPAENHKDMTKVAAVDNDRQVDTRAGIYTPRAERKPEEHWYDRINLRGYTQMRYNHTFSGDRIGASTNPELRSVGDSSIGENQSFSFRRVRLVFSGDISDYLYLYIQPDFASTVRNQSGGEDSLHFAQLRDAYADIYLTKDHEYRFRAGQSKVPYGWENLQSSQNRLPLDRADALNSAVPSERDLGLFAYYTPTHVQELWKTMSKEGLKTSGDYGILGLGIYNGQTVNRAEANDEFYLVAHSTYPFD